MFELNEESISLQIVGNSLRISHLFYETIFYGEQFYFHLNKYKKKTHVREEHSKVHSIESKKRNK